MLNNYNCIAFFVCIEMIDSEGQRVINDIKKKQVII